MLAQAREQKANQAAEDPQKIDRWKEHAIAQEVTEKVYQ